MQEYAKKAHWYLRRGPLFLLLSTGGRFQAVRSIVLRLYRRFLTAPVNDPKPSASLLSPLEPETAARTLERDGILPGIRLLEQAHSELHTALLGLRCYGEGSMEFPFYYQEREQAERRYGRKFLLAHYYDFAKVSGVMAKLARDPALLEIARLYFGTEPVLIGMRAWWSFASPASPAELARSGQVFHYDIDDYRSMAVFFYLTDVDASSGPHICVRGSHRLKKLRHVLAPLRARSDEELIRTYGAGSMLSLRGSAGAGFAEDTFCFHKGLHPEKRDRLTLQLRYAMRDYGGASEAANAKWYQTAPKPRDGNAYGE